MEDIEDIEMREMIGKVFIVVGRARRSV